MRRCLKEAFFVIFMTCLPLSALADISIPDRKKEIAVRHLDTPYENTPGDKAVKKTWRLTQAEKQAILGQTHKIRSPQLQTSMKRDDTSLKCALIARFKGNIMNISEGSQHSFGVAINPKRLINFKYRWGAKSYTKQKTKGCLK